MYTFELYYVIFNIISRRSTWAAAIGESWRVIRWIINLVNKTLQISGCALGQCDVAVNCSGLGARQLCGDTSVLPIRGQVDLASVKSFLSLMLGLVSRYCEWPPPGSRRPSTLTMSTSYLARTGWRWGEQGKDISHNKNIYSDKLWLHWLVFELFFLQCNH